MKYFRIIGTPANAPRYIGKDPRTTLAEGIRGQLAKDTAILALLMHGATEITVEAYFDNEVEQVLAQETSHLN